MTTPQPPQDPHAKPPSPATPPEAARKGEPPSPKKGASYVFKIAPADPKTSFDFEDVADK